MTDDALHELACRAGALVLGEPGSTQQYMLSLAELAKFAEMTQRGCAMCAARNWKGPPLSSGPMRVVEIVPPCPVPLPVKNAPAV